LYICADAGFKGTCENLHLDPGKCYNAPNQWNKNISSAGPDNGTFCALYPEYDCHGKALPFTFPGMRALSHYGFDDTSSSYRCEFL
ncbi:hypothetical protein BU26DRAFT_402487, partial [Trematosphaeria pertusa]